MTTAFDAELPAKTPWPDDPGDGVLFVIVGEGAAEHAFIRARIDEARPADASAEVAYVVTGPDDRLDWRGFEPLAAASSNIIVVPVGVGWIPRRKRGARLLDIIADVRGAPRSERRKERLFREAPDRWKLLVGEAASIGALRARFRRRAADEGDFAAFVARQAALTIDREYRRFLGVDVKLPHYAVATIMARDDFRRDLEKIAADSNRAFADVEAEAKRALTEIAPAPTPLFVAIMAWLTSAVCSMGYEKKIVYDERSARELDDLVRRSPTAFLFTHKSHIDGMAMLNFAFEREFPLLHVIGGINMAFAGIGTVAKKSGVVFIRRSFQDDPVYKAALRHYLAWLLEKRFPIAWSLEGTRSRIGKLMPPRYGILKYVLEAAQAGGIDDLKIIPVSVYYDLIPEIASYATEQTGAAKKKESLAWFIGYVAGMRKPLGRIFMNFGAPIAAVGDAATLPANDSDVSSDLRRIAFDAAVNINAATPLTASGVLSFIMIAAAPQALTRSEVVADLLALKRWATLRGVPMTADFDDVERTNIRAVARALVDVGVLTRHEGGLEPIYSIAPGQQFTVSYYRNTVMHFFIDNAFIELALAEAMESEPGRSAKAFWNAAMEVRDLFKFEFFYPPKAAFRQAVARELALQNPNWENLVNAGGRAVEQLLESLNPLFAHGTLKPYIEAYSVVADAFLRLKPDHAAGEKEIVAACLKLGPEAVLRQRITGEESIAKFLYSNGYQLAVHRGLVDADADARELYLRRSAFAREMKDVQRRLRLVEAIAARRRSAHDQAARSLDETGPSLRVVKTG